MGESSPVPPAAKQPEIVEAELGVREYWYEVFRRVVVVPYGDCILLSLDVYKLLDSLPEGSTETIVLADGRVKVHYVKLDVTRLPALNGVKPEDGHMLIVESQTLRGKRVEVVNVKLRYRGIKHVPSYDDVWRVYRAVVMLVEGRDPSKEPLRAPEPIAKVYESRLAR